MHIDGGPKLADSDGVLKINGALAPDACGRDPPAAAEHK